MMRNVSLVVAAALGAPGCSVVFQERPALTTATPSHGCSDSNLMPVIDTVAGSAVALAGGALTYDEYHRGNQRRIPIAGAALIGTTFAYGSALSGFGWASECRQQQMTTSPPSRSRPESRGKSE
jgi:hypothetical protein